MSPLFRNHPLHFSKLSVHLLVAVNATLNIFVYVICEYLFMCVSISLCAEHEYPSNIFVYTNMFSYTFEYLCVQLLIDSISALDSKIYNKCSSVGSTSCYCKSPPSLVASKSAPSSAYWFKISPLEPVSILVLELLDVGLHVGDLLLLCQVVLQQLLVLLRW